jgi:hypothetical protein
LDSGQHFDPNYTNVDELLLESGLDAKSPTTGHEGETPKSLYACPERKSVTLATWKVSYLV